jgi:putative SOS response-associated peptidase YedK
MCGRYTQTRHLEALAKRFRVLLPDAPELDLPPRYNVAPSQAAHVVAAPEGRPRLELMRWGLIPGWAKDASIAFKTINARAETLSEKPAFRDAFARRRCLVAADGFYEWKKEGKAKRPMRIALREDGLFAMAGLWDSWIDQAGKELRSFTIVTVPANAALEGLHDRMPAILRPEDEAAWLEPHASPEALARALRPLEADRLVLAPVSSRVNAAANEGPELLRPDPETPTFL